MKTAIRIHVMMCRAIQMISSSSATAIAIPSRISSRLSIARLAHGVESDVSR